MTGKKPEDSKLKERSGKQAEIDDEDAFAAPVEAGKNEEKKSGQKYRYAESLNHHWYKTESGDIGAVAPAGFDLLNGEPKGP